MFHESTGSSQDKGSRTFHAMHCVFFKRAAASRSLGRTTSGWYPAVLRLPATCFRLVHCLNEHPTAGIHLPSRVGSAGDFAHSVRAKQKYCFHGFGLSVAAAPLEAAHETAGTADRSF